MELLDVHADHAVIRACHADVGDKTGSALENLFIGRLDMGMGADDQARRGRRNGGRYA